jgi:hypothetical protein
MPLEASSAPDGLKVDRETANARVGTWLREVVNARMHATKLTTTMPDIYWFTTQRNLELHGRTELTKFALECSK